MADGGHILSKEFCNFDGKVNRCESLVTITACVYHPILRKQVILANMECESESTETVSLFWSLFRGILRKVTEQPDYKFSPRGWCSDMAGSNFQGLKIVFGEVAVEKVKGCEFHFKDCRNRLENHAQKNQGTMLRNFIFPAFSSWNGAPTMNQAEVVHAGWKHKDI